MVRKVFVKMLKCGMLNDEFLYRGCFLLKYKLKVLKNVDMRMLRLMKKLLVFLFFMNRFG